MGCFSWMFADKGNKAALKIGEPGSIICPDGSLIATASYDGYGCFGSHDEFDVYELVADWNRAYLIDHPDYIVPQHGRRWDKHTKDWVDIKPKKVSEYEWWPAYSDLSLSSHDVELYMQQTKGDRYCRYRSIGIDISCYDDQNAKLPYPIKIISSDAEGVDYKRLPPSEGDPNQGFDSDYWNSGF